MHGVEEFKSCNIKIHEQQLLVQINSIEKSNMHDMYNAIIKFICMLKSLHLRYIHVHSTLILTLTFSAFPSGSKGKLVCASKSVKCPLIVVV